MFFFSVLQGYKFNVFYPDLIDRQETPTYHLEKADHPGFAILRFHAGPPYEDIAFKVCFYEHHSPLQHRIVTVLIVQ